MSGKMKVACYARFSSTKQRDESIETQLECITRYCNNNNMEIVATFVDEAKTATSDEREGFLRMIEESKQGKWEAIILYSLDRFSRNTYNHYYYKNILDNYGVRLYAVIDGITGNDNAEAGLMENIKVGLAQYYSHHLSLLVLDSSILTSKKGLKVGGVDNLGFYTVDQVYHIDEEEAKVIKLIFDLAEQNYSKTQICNYLNDNGITTKRGNKFYPLAIDRIINNKKYIGYMVYNQTKRKPKITSNKLKRVPKPMKDHIVIKDKLPKIITEEQYDNVQNLLMKNKENKYFDRNIKHLLSGLVRCEYCGSNYVFNRSTSGKYKKKRNIYRCPNYRIRNGNCIGISINADYLERYVLSLLDSIVEHREPVKKLKGKMTKIVEDAKDEEIHKYEELKLLEENEQKEIFNLQAILPSANGLARASLLEIIEQKIKDSLTRQIEIKDYEKLLENDEEIVFLNVEDMINEYKELRKELNVLELRTFLMKYLDKVIIGNDNIEVIFNFKNLVMNSSKDILWKNNIERSIVARNKF